MTEIVKEIENRSQNGELTKKRFTCACCGKTWIELVGVVVARRDEEEDFCFHIGVESENCRICRFRPLDCQECGSKDVFEVTVNDVISGKTPLSFKEIRRINRGSDTHVS